MGERNMMPMKLIKCEHCGLYHFFIGNVTLNMTETELWVMGNIIAQSFLEKGDREPDISVKRDLQKPRNMMN
ncbi:MAG: hypothetical protein J7J07_06895 [Syntrophobacterales bacterium]|nr:hypothetical protein [Syntrophobacterales bacterium]